MSTLPIEPAPEPNHTTDEPSLRLADSGAHPNRAPSDLPSSLPSGLQSGLDLLSDSPLDEHHFRELRQATKRAKPINKAAGYAKFSGWTTLLAGALSIPFALGNTPMLIFAIVLAGIGTRELTLRRALRAFEPGSTAKLAINQLMLGGALASYAVFMLMSPTKQTLVESAMETDSTIGSVPEMQGIMDDMIQLEHTVNAMIYVGMIGAAIFFQGGTALYYLTKGSKLNAMLRETPPWVIRVHQSLQNTG